MKSILSGIFVIAFVVIYSGCKKTSLELLCRYNENSTTQEIYLIKNHPKNDSELAKLIYKYNSDLSEFQGAINRTYLKDNKSRSILGLRDDIDYSESKCANIDTRDILFNVSKYELPSKRDTIVFYKM